MCCYLVFVFVCAFVVTFSFFSTNVLVICESSEPHEAIATHICNMRHFHMSALSFMMSTIECLSCTKYSI